MTMTKYRAVMPPHVPTEVAAMAMAHGYDCTFEELRRLGDASPVDAFGVIAVGPGCWIRPGVLDRQLQILANRFGWQSTTGDMLLKGPDDDEEEEIEEAEDFDDDDDDDDFDSELEDDDIEPDEEPMDYAPWDDDDPPIYDDDDDGNV
jgi:hypothetical protein